VRAYEEVWRTKGTERLAELFTPEVSYLASPWVEPVRGLDALATFWEAERAGPDEAFTMSGEVLAVDADVAVVRVSVDYGDPEDPTSSWRDLWVLRFAAGGRCSAFEEWPFSRGVGPAAS
jgi:SnoaL-like domain